MTKLYIPLHTAALILKKQFLTKAVLFIVAVAIHVIVQSQCTPPAAPVITPNPAFVCLGNTVMLTNNTQQFCSGPVNIAVPDGTVAGASHTINVSGIPAACTISNMSVVINMSHTWMGDMVFALKAPNGMVINLDYYLSGTTGAGATTGFINTVISSNGTTSLSAGLNPFTGTFRGDLAGATVVPPSGPLGYTPTTTQWAPLFTTPNGAWTLAFYDGATGETGVLHSWCLNFTTPCSNTPVTAPVVWSPNVGLFLDAACTIPYVAGTQTNTIFARPINAGSYTYSATVQNLPAPPISFSNTTGIAMSIGGVANPYSSDITVSGLPVTGVKVASVVLHNFNHTRSEDVDIILQSPTGQSIMLMSDAGNGSTGNVTYTFADNGFLMTNTAANVTGVYKPVNFGVPDNFPVPGPGSIIQPLPQVAQFNGNFNGLWKLFVIDDDASAGQGSIAGGYTINFDTTIYCTSAATLVNVVAGAAATITTQPADQKVCIGNNAVFTVTAAGGILNYQWQTSTNGGNTWTNLLNAGIYNGVNTAVLTITTPTPSMSGSRYRVVINGGAGCTAAATQAATLTVNPKPTISFYSQPYHLLLPGLSTTLTSVLTPPNSAATYTWWHNYTAVPGGTADTLLVDFANIGLYQVSVTDTNGCTNISDTTSIRDSALGRIFIYPNPSNGNFQLRMYSEPNTSLPRAVIVYNGMGTKVVEKNYNQTVSYQNIYVDVRRNGKGLYWVEVQNKDGKRIGISKVLIQ